MTSGGTYYVGLGVIASLSADWGFFATLEFAVVDIPGGQPSPHLVGHESYSFGTTYLQISTLHKS